MKKNAETICDEDWRAVEGWHGYFVSASGEIKSLHKTWKSGTGHSIHKSLPEHIKKQTIDSYGYYRTILRENGKSKYVTVHRLIAIAFIPNPDNKSQVNHKDGNKLNNSASNLEWATPKENINHAYRNGLSNTGSGETSRNKKLTREIVNEIRASKDTNQNLARKYTVTAGTIKNVRKFKSWL